MYNKTICFGKWHSQLDYLDCKYHNVGRKLIKLAAEAGVDPYGRYIDAEPLVDFAIQQEITNKTADYIYRHYVYQMLSKHENIDVEQEELRYLYNEFYKID
jgi:hypothetical protein